MLLMVFRDIHVEGLGISASFISSYFLYLFQIYFHLFENSYFFHVCVLLNRSSCLLNFSFQDKVVLELCILFSANGNVNFERGE